MSPPRQLQTLAQRIATGHLRGEAAFEAVVAVIAAAETPVGASEQMAARIRDEVLLGVSHDRTLCELLYAAGVPAGAEHSAAVPAWAPAPEPTPASPPRRERADRRGDEVAAHGRLRAPGRAGRSRKRRPADDSIDELDSSSSMGLADEPTTKQARRTRIVTGAAVVGVLVVLAAMYLVSASSPCDDLVEDACKNLGKMCDPLQARARLKQEGVNRTVCATAQEGVVGVEDPAAYRKALAATLGFDLLGGGEEAPPVPTEANAPPEPLAIVAGQTTMSSLCVDGSHTYWTVTQPPAVYRISSIGGEPELMSQTPMPGQLDVSENFAYWISAVPEAPKIWADKVRGEHDAVAVELVEGFTPALAAFMGPEAAFIDGKTGAVHIVAVANDTPRQLAAPSELKPVAIAGNGQTVVWSTPGPAATLMAAPREGGAPRILAQGLTAALLLRLDDAHVYWADPEIGSISAMPLAGGEARVLVSSEPGISDVAVGSRDVYWSNAQSGNVSTVPKEGGAARVVATGLQAPRYVALDGAAVFWESGGVVYRLPR